MPMHSTYSEEMAIYIESHNRVIFTKIMKAKAVET